MAFYKGIYKCQLCGWTQTAGDGWDIPDDRADQIVTALADHTVKRKGLRIAFPLVCAHTCGDGKIGVAQFVGIVKSENEA